MRRLIKAEWYRVRHAGLLKWMVLVCVIQGILPMLVDLEWYGKSVSEFLPSLYNATIFLPMFVSSVISVCIGMGYQNKVLYYEIMDGHKASDIIFSRLLFYGMTMTAGVSLALGSFLLAVWLRGGTGELKDIGLRLFLLLVIVVHICAVSALLAMSTRHMLAVLVSYLRFLLVEEVFALFLPGLAQEMQAGSEAAAKISDWFILGQFQKVLTGDLNSHLTAAVIVSLVLESALWFAMAYRGMKKKRFR